MTPGVYSGGTERPCSSESVNSGKQRGLLEAFRVLVLFSLVLFSLVLAVSAGLPKGTRVFVMFPVLLPYNLIGNASHCSVFDLLVGSKYAR